jgi:hypothetical protein
MDRMKKVRAPDELVPLINEKLKAETSNIVEIGNLLLEARSNPELGHGRWLPWLNDNFAMSARTAERYCAAAEYVKDRHLKSDTVSNLSARLLYALAQHDYSDSVAVAILKEARTRRVGIGRATALEDEEDEKLAAAEAKERSQREAEDKQEAEDILGGPPPDLPPAPEPAVADILLPGFDTAVRMLKPLHTKPLSKFVGTAYSADDLQAVAEFLNHVAEAIRKRQAA